MKKLFKFTQSFLDKLVFAFGLFAGSQIPGFIIQYRQRLGGHLEQAEKQFHSFQVIADKYHNGSIENLIKKHLTSNDSTFHSEGDIIRNLADEVKRLTESYKALESDLFNQIKFLILNIDREIAKETWNIYEPGLIVTPQAVTCALLFGFVFSLVFNSLIGTAKVLTVRKKPTNNK